MEVLKNEWKMILFYTVSIALFAFTYPEFNIFLGIVVFISGTILVISLDSYAPSYTGGGIFLMLCFNVLTLSIANSSLTGLILCWLSTIIYYSLWLSFNQIFRLKYFD